MTVGLSIASAIHDRDPLERYLMPSLDALDGDPPARFLLDNTGNAVSGNLAQLYNVLLRLEGPSTRIIVHPDVTFASDFGVGVATAIARLDERGVRWGALGTVGRAWDGNYVWGHEIDDLSPVCTVDACCVVVDTSQGIAFDQETFDGLHCHVEDYCMQCHAAGLGVFVAPVALEHVSATFATHGSRWGDYDRYHKRLTRKWRKRFPGLTTT